MSDGKSESLENVIEREYFESYPLNNEICKIEKNIKMLQIDYDAKLETFTVPKKIKSLKIICNEKHSILTKKLEMLKDDRSTWVKQRKLEQEIRVNQLRSSNLMLDQRQNKLQLFMDTIRYLEGSTKMAVPKDRLMTRLLWTKEFTSDEVENYIKRFNKNNKAEIERISASPQVVSHIWSMWARGDLF